MIRAALVALTSDLLFFDDLFVDILSTPIHVDFILTHSCSFWAFDDSSTIVLCIICIETFYDFSCKYILNRIFYLYYFILLRIFYHVTYL